MAYALVQDLPLSWERYERFARHLVDPVPEGLLLHLAGPTDEGFRVIDIWDSERSSRAPQARRLRLSLEALGASAQGLATLRDLHGLHLVIGPAVAIAAST
jgi:hypothetical protein